MPGRGVRRRAAGLPGWDERYIETFGFTMEDLGEQGAMSLETKLRSAGKVAVEATTAQPAKPQGAW